MVWAHFPQKTSPICSSRSSNSNACQRYWEKGFRSRRKSPQEGRRECPASIEVSSTTDINYFSMEAQFLRRVCPIAVSLITANVDSSLTLFPQEPSTTESERIRFYDVLRIPILQQPRDHRSLLVYLSNLLRMSSNHYLLGHLLSLRCVIQLSLQATRMLRRIAPRMTHRIQLHLQLRVLHRLLP
jgi:hypothetical protein